MQTRNYSLNAKIDKNALAYKRLPIVNSIFCFDYLGEDELLTKKKMIIIQFHFKNGP